MSKELEGVKKKRRFMRKSVTDSLKLIDEALAEENSHARVQVLKDNILSKWNDLTEVQASLSIYLEDSEIDSECAAHNEYEMRVMDYMARMTKYLSVNTHAENSNWSNESGSSLGSTCKVQVRLPKIELPTFDGDILCWQSYYQSVKVSIVDNSALADVQKLEYIMRSLKGVAAESVKGFSIVAENYESVLSTLKERFGHSRLILDAHMRGLIHLPGLSAEDATSMRVFYDKVVGHVRSVESMGEKYSSETLAPVLVPLIVDNLPKKLVEKAKESSTQAPNVESKTPKNISLKEGFHKNPSFRRSSTLALRSSTQTQEKECVVCGKDHNVWSCINFLSLTVKERFRKVSAKGLCFLCLEGGHRSNSCSRKTLCKHCRGCHHHLLHTDQLPPNRTHPDKTEAAEGQSASQEDASKNVSKNVTANSVGTDDIGEVILQTVSIAMECYGYQWSVIDSYGVLWIVMECYRELWSAMDTSGVL
ncbi:Hypothetical predicted protein [Paramuricea clavata]|uniref:Uncharacterized protein n=1 Tax=Paramuricea clavata TaxID=317549 RepID=A0A6S7IBA3_PARCT|nr:Hypothetical predicted protein [Paramuricea clavata]